MADLKGLKRLTDNAKRVLSQGEEIARVNNSKEYQVIHLFYSILNDRSSIINELFLKLGIDYEETKDRVANEIKISSYDKPSVKTVVFSEELKKVINDAIVIAQELNTVYVGIEHLFLSIFKQTHLDFVRLINEAGLNYQMVKDTLMGIVTYPALSALSRGNDDYQDFEEEKEGSYFSRNMNEASINGEISNITGRDKEIQRLIHILARKSKNNPILVGEAGVGKTAIVEGFVNMIVQKKVPASFINKKVLSVDIAGIVSGARLRGDVEERITAVINEAIEDGNTILFIDEIHMIVGAGSTGGKDSLDIANILKPYLTKPNLSVIGATTHDEYSKYFEEDTALSRRFQPIFVDELSPESAKEVIYQLLPEFERFHNLKIQKEAVDTAVALSAKFIQDRFLPDKALDIIDEAAASVKIGREFAIEPELSELGNNLMKVQSKKNKALKEANFELASKYKEDEEKIVDNIEATVEGKKKVKKKYSKVVTADLIKDIVVEMTKIPIAASDISDKNLKDLGTNLKARIIGQDAVIDNVAKAIQRSHLGLNGEKRPLSSFLFLGPTGVGKTELARSLAREVFGSESLMYQINMSEFMEMHSVAKLIGAPPGYVGYQEGGQLTSFVKRKPYSVVLFDEIEKAHPDTLNILLQILEEGELTDGKGSRVSFRNTIVILTSNIGASTVRNDSRLGFDVSIDDTERAELDRAYEDMKETILEKLKEDLRPELINRIDSVDVFRGLSRDDTAQIARLIVEETKIKLLSKGIRLDVSEEVVQKINELGFSKDYGARNIRRQAVDFLENRLSEYLLTLDIGKKRTQVLELGVGMSGNDVTFTVK
jgi:ATP-dependent Clp protease ATP-binding subunit ClpC